MNQQLIIKLAKEAGFMVDDAGVHFNYYRCQKQIEKFAELILQANKQDSELHKALMALYKEVYDSNKEGVDDWQQEPIFIHEVNSVTRLLPDTKNIQFSVG